jgi:glycerol-3-phosphate dehydrogenase (NAD(P)+)
MQANCIIIAVPMAALSSVLLKAKTLIQNDAVLISTAKGIEESTLALPNDIIMKILPPPIVKRACYLSGPSFAVELAMDLPTALTLASADQDSAIYVQKSLSSKQCRLYRSDDVIGVNVGGALKNVIAIAAGASLGLGLGKNALAALITRGLAEMARLARCLNGKASTLSGLSGAGDLILSCTDDMSRNHRLGTLLVEGVLLDDALKTIGSVVEGAKTAKAIPALEKKHRVSLPISNAVYRVLYEGLAPKMAIATLLERELKEEHL